MRWYLRYPISYRNLEEMMIERGVDVDHTTVYRWVQRYAPEFEKRIRWYTRVRATSWRVDETYIKVKGKWKFLYRAVDKHGNTLDFMLFSKRNYASALRFFRQVLASTRQAPDKITTDKHSSYNMALNTLKQKGEIRVDLEHRQQKYLNNIIEQDHRRIKRIVRPMMGFKSFNTAKRTIKGIEAMAMMIKQQCDMYARTIPEQVRFVNRLFHIYT
jgi:IS6 family transposase